MSDPLYKELTDAIQGNVVTGVELVGSGDTTKTMTFTFNNGVALTIEARRDMTFGPVIDIDIKTFVPKHLAVPAASTGIGVPAAPTGIGTPVATRPQTHVGNAAKFITDVVYIEQLLHNADRSWPGNDFVNSVRLQYDQTRRITGRQAQALENIVNNHRR